jgi:hypothetical protein
MKFLAIWLLSFLPPLNAPRPRPDLSPAEVVQIVVTALRNNNSVIRNSGVYTAYRFASPENRAVTGPYGRFIRLAKGVDFTPLFDDYPSEFEAIQINGDHAAQRLTIHLNNGRDTGYRFSLSRQRDGPNRGDWMVDGVERLPL